MTIMMFLWQQNEPLNFWKSMVIHAGHFSPPEPKVEGTPAWAAYKARSHLNTKMKTSIVTTTCTCWLVPGSFLKAMVYSDISSVF